MRAKYPPPGPICQSHPFLIRPIGCPTVDSTTDGRSALTPVTRSRIAFAVFAGLGAMLCPAPAPAQGTVTNGWTHEATIAPAGETDSWTFSASVGDRIVLRVG